MDRDRRWRLGAHLPPPRREQNLLAASAMSERTRKDRTTLDYVRPGSEERGRLRESFDANDLNRDGRLTLGEFIRFMQALDENLTSEECQIGFDAIDGTRDGAIDFEEFYAWWTRA
jgi:calmodulin